MHTIVIAGGGTGGHVFPGLAVAHAMTALADVSVVFVGSPRGLESEVVPKHGFALELLEAEPMKGGGPAQMVRGALVAAKAMRHATGLVGRLRPSAVLSVGGYAAGPAAIACVRAGVPLAVLEPNAILGLTNRMLAPFARRGYVAWSQTARHFRGEKARIVGVPLRSGFEAKPPPPVDPTRQRRLLVLGGSQGATALNERMPSAVARVCAKVGRISVVHQSGKGREGEVAEAYVREGVRSVEVVPFLSDVAERMAAADVIVARGGAVTVAEIAAIGRPSLLVPYPYAADDHQAKNATALAELGGAICIRQEAADYVRIATELTILFEDDAKRAQMAEAARRHGHPDAARTIARDLLALAGVRLKPKEIAPPKKLNGGTNGSSTMRIAKEVS